jgi:hypothetical protein
MLIFKICSTPRPLFIGRFYRKRLGKVPDFAKVLIPIDGVDQALSQDFSLSGSKLRVARWDKLSAPGPGG